MIFLPARRYASESTSYGPVSVCLSVTVGDGRIELVLGMGDFFRPSYNVFSENSSSYKNEGTSLCNIVVNSRISPRHIDRLVSADQSLKNVPGGTDVLGK